MARRVKSQGRTLQKRVLQSLVSTRTTIIGRRVSKSRQRRIRQIQRQ